MSWLIALWAGEQLLYHGMEHQNVPLVVLWAVVAIATLSRQEPSPFEWNAQVT